MIFGKICCVELCCCEIECGDDVIECMFGEYWEEDFVVELK